MQQVFAWINVDNTWQSLNTHDDIGMLETFTLNWGVEKISEQPDPAVLDFELIDRIGNLAADPTIFAGGRILLQYAARPTYASLKGKVSAYSACHETTGNLYTTIWPDTPDRATNTANTFFDGIITTGGTITPYKTGWRLQLTASSRDVLLKRLADNGPTSNDSKLSKYHWTVSGAHRIAELNRRMQQINAPQISSNLTAPEALRYYETNSHPTALELLHRTYASDTSMPLWYMSTVDTTSTVTDYSFTSGPMIVLQGDGTISTNQNGATYQPLDSADIIISNKKLTIPQPISKIVINAYSAKISNNQLEYDDTTVQYASNNQPQRLTDTNTSITWDSDAITADSSGIYRIGLLNPTQQQRDAISNLLAELNRRIYPKEVVLRSTRIDPLAHSDLYKPWPSDPHVARNGYFSRLRGSDGISFTTLTWRTIGGSITYEWNNHNPRITHTAHIITLPRYPLKPTYSAMSNLRISYNNAHIQIADFQHINRFEGATA